MVKKRGNHAGRFQKKETLLRRSFLETCMQEGRGGAGALDPAASKDPWFSAHFLTVLGVRDVPDAVPDGAGGSADGKDPVREEKSEAVGPSEATGNSGSNEEEPASGEGGGENPKKRKALMMGIVAKQKVLDERKRVQNALSRWDLGGSRAEQGPKRGGPPRLSRGALMLAVKALSQYTSQTAALSVVLGSVKGAGLVGIDALSLIIREIRSGHKALDQAEGSLQRQFDFLSKPAVAPDDPILRAVEEKAGAPKRKRAKTLASSIKALPAGAPAKIDDVDKQAVAALQLLFGGSEGMPSPPALSPPPPAAPPPAAGPTPAAAGPEERNSPQEVEAAQTLTARRS